MKHLRDKKPLQQVAVSLTRHCFHASASDELYRKFLHIYICCNLKFSIYFFHVKNKGNFFLRRHTLLFPYMVGFHKRMVDLLLRLQPDVDGVLIVLISPQIEPLIFKADRHVETAIFTPVVLCQDFGQLKLQNL